MFDWYEDLENIGRGFVWIIGGAILTVVTYVLPIPFGVVFYGAILYGVVLVVLGIIEKFRG